MFFQTGKPNRLGQDTLMYLKPNCLVKSSHSACVGRNVLDLSVYELLSVGSKAVAGLPP